MLCDASLVFVFVVERLCNTIERTAIYFVPGTLDSKYFLYYLATFFGLLISLLLWYFPTIVSKKLVPLEPNSLSYEKLKLNDWYRLTFVVLGIFLLLSAIADLFYWASLSFYTEQSVIPVEFSAENKASIVTTVFEFILALLFIFSSKFIISFLRTTKVK